MSSIGAIDSGGTPTPGRATTPGDSGTTPQPGQILPGSFASPIVPNAAGGGPPGPGFVSVSVPTSNLTAAATGQTDGTLGYVGSPLKAMYKLSRTDTQTPDGITVIAATGGGNWLRQPNVTDTSWLLQSAWTIDSVAGNDNNLGSAASPIATWAEFARRMNVMTLIAPLVASISVFLANDLPASDPVRLEAYLSNAVEIDVIGIPTTQGVASTFTAVTARNRAAPGTQWSVTDAANGATNFVAGNIGLQLVDTAVNSVAWIDAAPGGGVANLTETCAPRPAGGSPVGQPTEQAIVNGNAYRVQRPTQVTLSTLRVHGELVSTVLPSMRFFNVWFLGAEPQVETAGGGYIRFEQCRFDGFPNVQSSIFGQVIFSNCWMPNGFDVGVSSSVSMFAGELKAAAFLNTGARAQFDTDVLFQVTAAVNIANGALAVLGNVGSLGARASIVAFADVNGTVKNIGILWGNPTGYNGVSSTASGIRITYPNGTFVTTFGNLPGTALVTFPSPTGTGSPFFNPGTATWAVSPGPSTLTLINTSIAGSGYGGAMFDPITNSYFGPS